MNSSTFGNILYISRAYMNYRRMHLPEGPLVPADMLFITFIHRHEGCMQDQLVKFTGMDKTTVAHRMNRLEALGYVERRVSETDARRKLCCLTEKGTEIYPEIHRQYLEFRQGVLGSFTEEELALLDRMTAQMKNNAEKLISEAEHRNQGKGATK